MGFPHLILALAFAGACRAGSLREAVAHSIAHAEQTQSVTVGSYVVDSTCRNCVNQCCSSQASQVPPEYYGYRPSDSDVGAQGPYCFSPCQNCYLQCRSPMPLVSRSRAPGNHAANVPVARMRYRAPGLAFMVGDWRNPIPVVYLVRAILRWD
jgi:hypothetical protein